MGKCAWLEEEEEEEVWAAEGCSGAEGRPAERREGGGFEGSGAGAAVDMVWKYCGTFVVWAVMLVTGRAEEEGRCRRCRRGAVPRYREESVAVYSRYK